MKSIYHCLLVIVLAMAMQNCKRDQKNVMNTTDTGVVAVDVHSYARPEEAVIKHLSLVLHADFVEKKLTGTATYDIDVMPGADSIVLDIKGLDIMAITVDGVNTDYSIGEDKEWQGQPLVIPVSTGSKKLEIRYSTRPEADALQWLEPSQTAGKKLPYLFTQGQAILTRTWIPIQDSPGIRLTYTATISAPPELMAVMSASNPQTKTDNGTYSFNMPQPIPAYLIALAIGDMDFRTIGKRTGVYAEPSMVDKAAAEFIDMEKMVEAAEALYGPYLWERYDVIVLPPSFPFGGMENPRLTFATPTIIAGDRSLIALIAHELAHSWSGNLVTNATWNDFWLNEGFTVYFELRIMEALYGKSYSDMLTSLGHQSLVSTIEELEPAQTHLLLDLKGKNPDEGMNDIAYEKGAHFLMMLEEKAGREKLDAFLKKYFAEHAFQSMSTTKFLNYLEANLIKPNQLDINTDAWVFGPGLPSDGRKVTSERFEAVDRQADEFLNGKQASSLETKEWTTHEWLHFILAMPDSLSTPQMKELDHAFTFTTSGNSEIRAAWYKLAIKQGYGRNILPSIRSFLVEVGRRKFLTPLYTALIEAGMREEAKNIYDQARPNYHSVSRHTIDALFSAQ